MRVCRVLPDVTAVERAFDYLVPDALGEVVHIGSIVRVPLHGRRVRGWVVADHIDSTIDPAKLQPLLTISSEGPPPDVIELCSATAYRYAGPVAPVLRTASPANNVRPGSLPLRSGGPNLAPVDEPVNDAERIADELAAAATANEFPVVVRWPPLADRRRLVARLLSDTGSTIVVVADGSRAAALTQWLRARGAHALLLHSDLPASTRTAAWSAAARGACIVVGGRMAALAPVPDLAVAIVVDDADEALQEERTPTWHAREVLAERADSAGAKFAVVSPAPTLAAPAYLHPIAPPSGFERAGWPRVEVVDLGDLPPGSGLITARLVESLRHAITAGTSAVCVLNVRGSLRLLACRSCGALSRWDAEGKPAWDISPDDVDVARPSFCPHCTSTKMRVLRAGIQRVSTELAAALHAEVATVDGNVETAPEVPVVVGTEAALHRAELRRRRPTVVAFIDFDQELFAPRYRAAEQALWLVVRAAHLLSGRQRAETRVLLQTTAPQHEVVQAAVHGDPWNLVLAERERRERYGLPPFAAIAELTGDSAAIERAIAELTRLDAAAGGVAVAGPSESNGKSRAIVRAPDREMLAATLSLALAPARELGRIRAHVDPPRI